MFVMRTIVPPSNLKKNSRKKYSSGFLCSLYVTTSLTFVYLQYSCFAASAANIDSEKKALPRTVPGYSRLFAWNCGLYWAGNFSHACLKCEILICAQNACENFFIHEAYISKTGSVTLYFFNAKTYTTARTECMCEIVKNTVEWNFSKLEITIFF